MSNNFPTHIFREYDIRGIADRELTDDIAYGIGRAFATTLIREGKKTVALGHDLRESGIRIYKEVSRGLRESGCDVTYYGMIPTPLLYFSVSHHKLDAGIVITGSHNPPEYNGFKLHRADRPVFGDEIRKIRSLIETSDYETGEGKFEEKEIINAYIDHVKGIFNFKRKIKVVLDSGHGMAGIVAPKLIKALGHDVTELYSNLDATFPCSIISHCLAGEQTAIKSSSALRN